MISYDVRVFAVQDGPPPRPPKELSPATVRARTVDHALKQVQERFKREGRKVRGISVGPNARTGKPALVVYLHGGA